MRPKLFEAFASEDAKHALRAGVLARQLRGPCSVIARPIERSIHNIPRVGLRALWERLGDMIPVIASCSACR